MPAMSPNRRVVFVSVSNNAFVGIGHAVMKMPCSYLLHLLGDGRDSRAYLNAAILNPSISPLRGLNIWLLDNDLRK